MIKEEYQNPYDSNDDPLANVPVTPLMIEHLRGTKPWVRFLSIMMFILSGFMILLGLVMLFAGSALGQRSGVGPIVGIIYILMSILYIAPAFFLHQYASYIGDFMNGGGDSAMESALGSQKSFWRFLGILTIIVIAIYALIFVVAILVGMSGFLMR